MPVDLTSIQLSSPTIEALERQKAEGYAARIRKIGLQQLSDLTSRLGFIDAGELRLGNRILPGGGFSGIRMAYPDSILTYDSETWNFVGVKNDVLQIGIRASDGVFLAGGGIVKIDENGILFNVSGDRPEWETTSTITWKDGSLETDDSIFDIQGHWSTAGHAFGSMAVDKDDQFGASSLLRLYIGEGSSTGYATIAMTKAPSILFHARFGGTDRAKDEITGSAHTYNIGNLNSDFIWHGDTNDNVMYLDAGNENITINASPVSVDYDLMLAGDGVLGLKETTTPTADTNYGKVYTKTDNKLYFQDGAGVEHEIAFV